MNKYVERAFNVRNFGKFGLGLEQAKRAVEVADQRFNGDDIAGELWVYANSLAVFVR